eukprot:3604181-Karenia_brevis.AAC.1
MLHKYLVHAPAGVHGLSALLNKCRVSSAGDNVGLTWLELYVLSIVASHTPSYITHGHLAGSHPSLAIQLKEFISASHSFLKFSLLPHFAELFHAPTSTYNRLFHHYGITSHFAHTKVHLDLPSHITRLLELVMLQLQSTLTPDQQLSLQQGTLQVPVHKFRGLGVVHAAGPLRELVNALSLHLRARENTARHPEPGCVT